MCRATGAHRRVAAGPCHVGHGSPHGRMVDKDHRGGRFLLTGSAPTTESHSGAGRITSMRRRLRTLPERGVETTTVSLAALLSGDRAVSGRTEKSRRASTCEELALWQRWCGRRPHRLGQVVPHRGGGRPRLALRSPTGVKVGHRAEVAVPQWALAEACLWTCVRSRWW